MSKRDWRVELVGCRIKIIDSLEIGIVAQVNKIKIISS